MDEVVLAERLREFNRFYTETIGSLDEAHEGTAVTLAQSRMLFTIRALPVAGVGELASCLQLDLAYASRVLGALEDAGLLRRTVSREDRRRRTVVLTSAGQLMLREVESRSNRRMLDLTEHLNEDEVRSLLDAMSVIRTLLERRSHDA